MKNKWNNILAGLLMDAATDANGGAGGGTASLLTPSGSGSTVPANAGNAGATQGTNPQQAANGTPAGNNAAGSTTADWRSALPKELQEDATIKKFTDVSTLAQSYVNAQKLIGADKIPVPSKHTTDEEWAGIYRKLGVPEKIDDYTVKFKEGVSVDDKFTADFRALAHKTGVHPKQAQALADWFSDVNLGAEQSVKAEVQKRFDTTVVELKKEWGNAYDLQLSRAQKVANELGGESFIKELESTGMGGNKHVIQFLAKIGEKMYAEHKFVEAQGGTNTMTPADLDKEINRLKTEPAYTDKLHPRHKDVLAEMTDLFQKRYPSK